MGVIDQGGTPEAVRVGTEEGARSHSVRIQDSAMYGCGGRTQPGTALSPVPLTAPPEAPPWLEGGSVRA